MLQKKRNDLAYERGHLVARLETVTSELASIDYSLKLLDPHWKPSKKPTRPPTSVPPMRSRSGQNSENYRWLLLLLQQDLVGTGSKGGEPHKFLKVPIEFSDIGANLFEYQS
jgi:hypothetical protein